VTATAAYDKKYDDAYADAVRSRGAPPSATIDGIKEASLVADWSRKRGRGERVPLQPPALDANGKLTQTAEMGRIDSPVGQKMAALDAEKAAKEKAEQEKVAAIAAAKAAKEARIAEANAAKEAARQQAVAQASPKPGDEATAVPPQASAMAAEPQRPRVLKRIWNKMFGS
jgi:hypothetical protein